VFFFFFNAEKTIYSKSSLQSENSQQSESSHHEQVREDNRSVASVVLVGVASGDGRSDGVSIRGFAVQQASNRAGALVVEASTRVESARLASVALGAGRRSVPVGGAALGQ